MLNLPEIPLWGDDIPWLSGLREKGRALFERIGMPNSKTEGWQKTILPADLPNIKTDNTEHRCDGNCHQREDLPFDAYQINFCNGKLVSEHFDFQQGLLVKPLVEAIFDGDAKAYLNKSFEMENFPFAALNTAFIEQGLFILVERGTKIEKPLYIHYHNHSENSHSSHIRNLIVLERQAELEICEYFDGEPKDYVFNNLVNEIFIGTEAVLKHYKHQKEAFLTYHISLNSVQIKSQGSYVAFCAQNQCLTSRHESFVKLLQEGASAEINGCYRLDANRNLMQLTKSGICDTTTNIRHLAPHTYSNQFIKGVAENFGTGVFQGQIHIAPDAQQCEGYQLHRALLLNNEAEIYCKPELEIFADDVKCSHGAASGDLDQQQLFYMQSRGIELEQAQKLLIEAYLDEVFAKIKNPQIAEWLKQNF